MKKGKDALAQKKFPPPRKQRQTGQVGIWRVTGSTRLQNSAEREWARGLRASFAARWFTRVYKGLQWWPTARDSG
eukprot:1155039-Pelagomonas_calceolata.AAC.1